VRKRKTVEG